MDLRQVQSVLLDAFNTEELRQLAEKLDAPVVMSGNGRGALPDAHPLALPHTGARALFPASDVVVVVASRLIDGSGNLGIKDATNAKFIYLNIDPREVTPPPAPPKPPVSDKQSDPAPTTRAEPRPAATLGSPLTAADYARTTTPSPATTSVIPAVKEGPRIAAPSSPPPVAAASSRQANLRLNYVEPWSVARIAFAVSVALMIVGVVAMTIFWVVLNVTGVWGQVNDAVTSVLSDDSSSFDITDYLGFWRLIGLTLVLSAINVVLMTALATIGAHLYNLAAQFLGGVEVTFSEDH